MRRASSERRGPVIDPDRLAEIVASIGAVRDRGDDLGGSLCATCVDVLEVSGAGIMLMIDGEHSGSLGASNSTMGLVEELQFTLGEGPCIDAYESRRPVSEIDLANPVESRWPVFAGPAVDAGVRAVFGFPVESGPVCIGALDVYLDRPGDLSERQRADARVLTEVISRTVLDVQANAPPGVVPVPLEATVEHRAVVHQASGMVSAQLGIAVEDALARIRAYAYVHGSPVNEVARDIVGRELRLDPGVEP